MLTDFIVDGIGVIDHAELHLQAGCIALTGETGAGKTLIVAGLGLLLGDRSDKGLIRSERDGGYVEARFEVARDHSAAVAAAELLGEPAAAEDAQSDLVEIVLARSVASDGRSRARINGRLVTAAALGDVASRLIQIAGQHDHHRLADRNFQRSALDAWAGREAIALAAEVRDLAASAASAARSLEQLRSTEREREREMDVLRYELAEIEAVSAEDGEPERLAAEIRRLEHAGEIAQAVEDAATAVRGDGGVEDVLGRIEQSLGRVAAADPRLGELAARVAAAAAEISDVGDELARSRSDLDPSALDGMRDRLGVITRLRRKYGEDLDAYVAKASAGLRELEGTESRLEELTDAYERATADANRAATRLGEIRREAARTWSAALEGLLGDLALAGARVEVRLESVELYEGGLERVDMHFAANPGTPPRPLSKVASGGELARLALAVHVLADAGDAGTMVFDEVDAGVGGAAAQAVGRLLAELAERDRRQVVVVTHLPQVAAFAHTQLRVEKAIAGGAASAEVRAVEGDERIEELSRMLAGLPESERARGHAEELLALATQGRRDGKAS